VKSQANSAPVRVLFVESNTELGGAQVALLTMLRHLDRGRVCPFFACLGFGAGDMPEQVARLGVPVHRLPRGRFRSLPATARKIARLCDLIRIHGIEVVFSNGGHAVLYARPAARLTQRPCAWWVHGYCPADPMKGHPIALAELFLQSDLLLANSRFTAETLHKVLPERGPIPLLPCGVDLRCHRPNPDAGAAARRAEGLRPDELVVGIFGRLQPWKGQHVLLQAAGLLARRGVAARFLVVGGSVFGLDPGYGTQLKALAASVGLNGQVAFLGQRADTNALTNACDVVVHASVEPEPWGLVVAEAMAAGRAVVATAAGGPLEMIEHGATGWLVPPGDPVALACALETLLSQPGLRCRLGEAARAHAEDNFGAEHAAQLLAGHLFAAREQRAA
jgi:glycosyltransferase involved in cell wall biosynthesis